jgi:hypothetical protein
MESVSRLAAHLDVAMLLAAGTSIASEATQDDHLPFAMNLAADLGRRYLIKYVRQSDLTRHSGLSGVTYFPGRHFVTPAPIAASYLQSALNLPPLPRPSGAYIGAIQTCDGPGPRLYTDQ